jgi:hypothetical protein
MHALYKKDGQVHFASTSDGRHWDTGVPVDYRKGNRLGRLTVFDGQFYSTSGDAMNVWVSRHSSDGTTATVEHTIDAVTGHAILAVHSGQLYCFVSELFGALKVTRKVENTWAEPYDLENRSWQPPSAASLSDTLHLLTYAPDGTPRLHTFDGEKLSDPTPLFARPAVEQGCLATLHGRLIALHR